MKTTKKLLVLCLIAVMGVVAVMPSTFSWFDHSGTRTGNNMRYERDGLPISVGTVTMETKKLTMDPDNPNELYYDAKGLKVPTGNPITSDTVNYKSGNNQYTQYYRTTFTNTSTTADAYVNFYLTNYTNVPNMYLGTIYPTITEKNQAGQASATTKAYNKVRVYFQDKAVNGWASKDKYVAYTTDGSTWQNDPVANNTGREEMEEAAIQDDGNTTWYYDVPSDTKSFYFYTEEQAAKSDDGWYRTTEVNNLSPKTGYYIDGSKSGYNHPTMHTYTNDKYVSIAKYYDTITISAGQRIKLTLPEDYYSGESLSFVDHATNATVNQNTGYLVAAQNVESVSGTVTTKVKGVLGDEAEVTTTLSTPETLDSVPVFLNFRIPKGTASESTVRDVVWYIRNEGNKNGQFTGTFFTK